jgi:hypothetical protein
VAEYVVDVTHTDRARSANGRYVEYRARVTVLTDTPTDAECCAAQMVAAIRDDLGGMVLSTAIVL